MIPLAHRASPLSAAELTRYSRQIAMSSIGHRGQLRLKSARVLVVGAGGLGSPVIAYLARAGVGTIGVIDDDLVAESNLHRQIVHDDLTVGQHKVESALASIARANPHVRAVGHRERLDGRNWRRVLEGYDLVVDGTDDFATRYLVSDATTELGLPCVWGTVLDTDGQVATFWSHSPLGVTLRDLYPDEPPASALSCATAGVLGPLCGVVASWMAADAVKMIVGLGEPLLGRMLSIDAVDGSTVEIRVRRRNDEASSTGIDRHPAEPVPDSPHDLISWISVSELRLRLHQPDSLLLLDVREDWERKIACIEGSVGIPLAELDPDAITALPDLPIVVHCHRGSRARLAREILNANGRPDVHVLHGGIDEWSAAVDSTIARY
ncbi:ThiF family adenylyltransferase [Microbacterium sp. LWH3-1.2]|uniref:ThiF family adenylyltransferase n=1 Tax=Microbacterium sp. LWH3-1.2 TaxID=3135256 RepID=UPI003447E20F